MVFFSFATTELCGGGLAHPTKESPVSLIVSGLINALPRYSPSLPYQQSSIIIRTGTRITHHSLDGHHISIISIPASYVYGNPALKPVRKNLNSMRAWEETEILFSDIERSLHNYAPP